MKPIGNDETDGKWRERFKHAQVSWLRVWGTEPRPGGGAAGPAPPRIRRRRGSASTFDRVLSVIFAGRRGSVRGNVSRRYHCACCPEECHAEAGEPQCFHAARGISNRAFVS